jgi:acetyl-CoA carboxylase carboxyltransferase component/DNA-binding response OmpR family regulator
MTDFAELRETIERGGADRYHEAAAAKGKLFARERIAALVNEGSFTEDGRYANALADGLPADGVVTGTATIDGRPVALMANDSTVKAGSWGARTVEKIIRIIEKAYDAGLPMIYLVDSAGARITDQVDMFPGRRGAGRIFRTQIRASGSIPQVCALFGPSAAGGAYIPAFCDFTAMVDGNASMYLGSPRMVEMVVSEKTTLEEMGGARLHCTVSGSGHFLAATEQDALDAVRTYLSYLPQNWEQPPPSAQARDPKPADLRALVPASERQAFDMRRYVRGLVDEDSFFEIHALWAREVVTGFARLAGQVIGVVANNPMFKGGVLFVDSADKAARFIQVCDAFGIPLLFLADVPGFMVGTAVERQGIIRHGAKMIAAMSDATVPKICVVVRKAYGAGLYAMAGPGFEPDATLALPTAKIAVMGAEAAVNAVYAGKLDQIADEQAREAETGRLRREYERDIDILRLASELVVDDIVEPEDLRDELIRRFAVARGKDRTPPRRRHGISPALLARAAEVLLFLYYLLMTRVLLAEDDTSISEPLSRALRREGYEVDVTADGPSTLDRALGEGVDLILLDIGLPELDGLEVCRRVRAGGYAVPVLILTARADEVDTVVGLDAGADDYVTKPFRLAELLARVRALLRRGTAESSAALGVRIDPDARRAWHGEVELDLTTKEFDLLWILLRDAGKVVTREQIMREVWDAKWWTSTKTLDMHISWLRRKLGDDAHSPRYITTVRGVGFRFERGD